MIRPVIVAIGYNRPKNLLRLLKTLENSIYESDNVTLCISIDYSGDDKCNKLADSFCWTHGNKIVNKHDHNLGLRNHFIECADLSLKYGGAIIFEDDVCPSPYFYLYTCQALDFYAQDEKIFALSLYSQVWNGYANRLFEPLNNGFDAYISQIECSWGECFIGDRWKEFKTWYEKNKDSLNYSYDVPHDVYFWKKSYSKFLLYYIVENEKYYVTPYISFSTNFHSAGTHIKKANPSYQVPIAYGTREYAFPEFQDAVKYDAFFESIELKKYLQIKYGEKIQIDYYGLKKNREDYDYVFTAAILPYNICESFGLQMHPVENNVLMQIDGDDLFIYDMRRPIKCKKRNWPHHYDLVKYEVKDLSVIDALFYAIYSEFFNK